MDCNARLPIFRFVTFTFDLWPFRPKSKLSNLLGHCFITLRDSEVAAQCIVIAPVCVCICLFVGPAYYSQRAVFASPLSAFSLIFFSCYRTGTDSLYSPSTTTSAHSALSMVVAWGQKSRSTCLIELKNKIQWL